MSSVFLFGASRGTGRCVAEFALARGHRVGGMVRSEKARDALKSLGVAASVGDVLEPGACVRALEADGPWDAVISTLGGGPLEVDRTGIRNAIDDAGTAGIRRFVLTSSLGVGSSRPFASPRLLAAISSTLLAKATSEAHLTASDLDWTVVRPGMLLDDPATGNAILDEDPSLHGSLSRQDLAALLLACIGDPQTHGRILGAVDRATLWRGRAT